MSRRRDWAGTLLGLVVFLGGVVLLVWTFRIAFGLFKTPPEEVLGLAPGKPMDVAKAGSSFAFQIVRVLLLVVMALVSSLIANKGIHMYASGRDHRSAGRSDPLPDDVARFTAEGGHEAR